MRDMYSIKRMKPPNYLDLLGSEGRQTGAHRVSHGLRVVTLEDGVQEPTVPEIYNEKVK